MIKLSNGIMMPKLGLGTYKMVNEEELYEVIDNAIKIGYRHFDTAQMYENEEMLGNAFSKNGIDRKDIFITTKLVNHYSKEKTKEKILSSLEKLKTDYIDLLLIHWPNHDDDINYQTWEVFEELYEKGVLKAIGVSNFTRYQMDQLLKRCKIAPMVNQVEMHPALNQKPLKEYLDKKNIKMISYGPLMRGNIFKEPYKEELEKIAEKYNATIPQIVIAWGLSRNIITIPKTVTKNRLVENYNSKNIKLTTDDIEKINKLNRGTRYYSDPSNNIYGNYIK